MFYCPFPTLLYITGVFLFLEMHKTVYSPIYSIAKMKHVYIQDTDTLSDRVFTGLGSREVTFVKRDLMFDL